MQAAELLSLKISGYLFAMVAAGMLLKSGNVACTKSFCDSKNLTGRTIFDKCLIRITNFSIKAVKNAIVEILSCSKLTESTAGSDLVLHPHAFH